MVLSSGFCSMKKTYLNPSIEVEQAQAEQMLASSSGVISNSNDINIETEDEGTRTISLINRFLQEGGIETDEDDAPRREGV